MSFSMTRYSDGRLVYRHNNVIIEPDEFVTIEDRLDLVAIQGLTDSIPIPAFLKTKKIGQFTIHASYVDLEWLPRDLVILHIKGDCYVKATEVTSHLTVKRLWLEEKNNQVFENPGSFRRFFHKVGVVHIDGAVIPMSMYELIPEVTHSVVCDGVTTNAALFLTRNLPYCMGIALEPSTLEKKEELYLARPWLNPSIAIIFEAIEDGDRDELIGRHLYLKRRSVRATYQDGDERKPIYSFKSSGFGREDIPPLTDLASVIPQLEVPTEVERFFRRIGYLQYVLDEIFIDEEVSQVSDMKIWGFPFYDFVYHNEPIQTSAGYVGKRLLGWTDENPPDEYLTEWVRMPVPGEPTVIVRYGFRIDNLRRLESELPRGPRPKLAGVKSTRDYYAPPPHPGTVHHWPTRRSSIEHDEAQGAAAMSRRNVPRRMAMPTIQRLNSIHMKREEAKKEEEERVKTQEQTRRKRGKI